MEFLAMLYTVLLVAICLMMALLLFRSGRPTGGLDEADCEELKDWLEEQLAAQAREFNARQDAIAQQNYAAIRSVSETLQTAVQSMSTTLGQGQDSQQRILERRLQSLEQANNQQMEQLRRAMVESMTALQAENTRKLDEIRHTVDEQLQDALQKRVTESFKAVNQQLEQTLPGCFRISAICSCLLGSAGNCFCSLSFSACRRSILISSGIHFRAVGRLIPKSRAHFDTLPPGCSAYQASTCFCCVGAPSRLMYGLSVVNLAIVFTSLSVVFLIISRRRPLVQLFSSYFPCKKTENNRKYIPGGGSVA